MADRRAAVQWRAARRRRGARRARSARSCSAGEDVNAERDRAALGHARARRVLRRVRDGARSPSRSARIRRPHRSRCSAATCTGSTPCAGRTADCSSPACSGGGSPRPCSPATCSRTGRSTRRSRSRPRRARATFVPRTALTPGRGCSTFNDESEDQAAAADAAIDGRHAVELPGASGRWPDLAAAGRRAPRGLGAARRRTWCRARCARSGVDVGGSLARRGDRRLRARDDGRPAGRADGRRRTSGWIVARRETGDGYATRGCEPDGRPAAAVRRSPRAGRRWRSTTSRTATTCLPWPRAGRCSSGAARRRSPASRLLGGGPAPGAAVFDAEPSGALPSRSAELHFHSTRAGASFECRVDEDDWTPCSSP